MAHPLAASAGITKDPVGSNNPMAVSAVAVILLKLVKCIFGTLVLQWLIAILFRAIPITSNETAFVM